MERQLSYVLRETLKEIKDASFLVDDEEVLDKP